ncbi:MAG: hypothetical protein PHU86_03495 [Patescibacteria group bacterium]|nr:hypothetical protein [Patescibacteria group bacterium]
MGWCAFLGWLIAEAEAPTKKGARLGLLFLVLYTVLFLVFGIWVYFTALCLVVLAILASIVYFLAKAFWEVISAAIDNKTHKESR